MLAFGSFFLLPFHPSEGRTSCMNQTRCAYQEIDLSPYCSNLDVDYVDLYLPFKGADIPMKVGCVMHLQMPLKKYRKIEV